MGKTVFNDQHQPMSSWLDKLASDEISNFTKADLQNDKLGVARVKKYAGISSTWDKSRDPTPAPVLDDASRHVANKIELFATTDEVMHTARQLLMSGVNLEKISSILNRKYSADEMTKFAEAVLPQLEKEYGKLGCIYLDPSLVGSCSDLSEMLKSSHKVSSVALRQVKQTDTCCDCTFNKKSHCIKLGLTISEQPEIKTVGEAKSILNKFASLRYINSYFIKSADMTNYYNRLSAGENPGKVVQEFLLDVNNRRASKQTTNARLAAKESMADKIENKQHIIKTGKSDIEVGTAFKQFLVRNPSLKAARAELIKRYSSGRIDDYLKEAKLELKKFASFIQTKISEQKSRVESAVEKPVQDFVNKTSSVKIASATKMAYSLLTFSQPMTDVKKTLIRSFGEEIAGHTLAKIASDKEAQFLGKFYIDSGLYSNASEMKQVFDLLNKKSSNMIFMVKESDICKLANNANGICSTTGLKIVKNATINNDEDAIRILKHAKSLNLISDMEFEKFASDLNHNGHTFIIKKMFNNLKSRKSVSEVMVKQIAEVASKYAKDTNKIQKIANSKWNDMNMLLEVISNNVINKQAFNTELKNMLNKSASSVVSLLSETNQYGVEPFTADKNRVSDVTLGQTF